MDAKKLELSSADAHERGGALPVMGAAPALVKGAAGVEPAGEAEKAITAKLEALGARHGRARSQDALGRQVRSRL